LTRIKVRVGQAEAEVEADPEHLREAIDLIPEIIEKLPRGKDAPSPALGPQPYPTASESQPSGSEIPTVTLEKGDSLAVVIGKFFSEPWGRERRKLSDVRAALQSYGLNYPKQSVAVALLRLAKTTRIRRFKAEDGEYVYTSGGVIQTQLRDPQLVEALQEQ
jgi:hypothetical protein